MKHRAAAILAALSVVATGALVATPADRPAPAAVAARAAVEGVGAAALTPATSVTSPAPRHSGPALRLSDASAPGKTTAVGTGALGDVIDAVTAGEALPDELAAQVHLDGTRLRVEVVHDDEAAARAAIAAVGGRDVTEVTGQMLVADVPAGRIERLQQASAVEAVSLPTLLSPPPGLGTTVPVPLFSGDLGGDVTSTTVMDRWHSAGFIGTGVAVGIVDYFHGGAWDDAEARGEVPTPAGTFCQDNGGTCDLFTDPSLTDVHGVAVAEAIHDMAPGATIYLATVITNEDLKAAIDYFAANDVKILSRSLGGFFDGPGDGTGVSADLVDYAVSLGMTWFNAAGNSGASAMPVGDGTKEWRGGYWRGTWRDVNNDRWMEFAHYEIDPSTGKKTGKITYFDTMFIRCSPYFRLRWSDWSASVPSDYDIYRFGSDGQRMEPGYTPNTQASKGDVPLELQQGSDSYFRCRIGEWIEVGIFRDASGSGVSKDVLELQGNFGDIYGTASSPYSAAAAFNDSKNPGMAAVGAVDPVAGIAIATYSSQGPTNDGRIKPALSAGSNFTSRAYTYTGDGGRFNGTSAATPVVAGAAAVVLGRYGAMTPAQLVTRLRTSHVIDRGSRRVRQRVRLGRARDVAEEVRVDCRAEDHGHARGRIDVEAREADMVAERVVHVPVVPRVEAHLGRHRHQLQAHQGRRRAAHPRRRHGRTQDVRVGHQVLLVHGADREAVHQGADTEDQRGRQGGAHAHRVGRHLVAEAVEVHVSVEGERQGDQGRDEEVVQDHVVARRRTHHRDRDGRQIGLQVHRQDEREDRQGHPLAAPTGTRTEREARLPRGRGALRSCGGVRRPAGAHPGSPAARRAAPAPAPWCRGRAP